jgi:hypothetical protein
MGENEETEPSASVYRSPNFSLPTNRRARSDATDPRQKKLASVSSQEYDVFCQMRLVKR